ncbi:hypothetical protein [Staphylococcus equorum]|uniref:hypothetical protein n=1 Tax=Staphylococcus equorum TaxID=246432 RepID=UPI001866B26B|nr:hypothetical protein [Staphylococcus equorum]
MKMLKRLLYLVYQYKILTIIAVILSFYTVVKIIADATNVDYFTLIPIPIMIIGIFGYLGVAIFSKKESKRLIAIVINLGMCVIALSYIPFINNLGDIPIMNY